ncbi:MAG: SGNH/GDSL hydrolase family protein [Actinomycetota bacterium]|nr:SGNH/GDSL hydrolase family protein [Actinomycetota bacterium]
MSSPGLVRFVALGDSFTEGMCDQVDADGRFLGWADRVAVALAQVESTFTYANLAVRGKLLDQTTVQQLPLALAMLDDAGRTLVSFHAGPNDVLRPRTDFADLLARYDRAVHLLRRSGAQVLLFTAIPRAGGQGRTSDRLAARFERFNDGVRATAARHDTYLQDNATVAAFDDRRLWADDRLHLAPEGHRRVAGGVLEQLGVADPALLGGPPGWWREPLPSVPPTSRGAALAADLRWARGHLAPWLGRRLRGASSGDGVAAKRPSPTRVGLSAGRDLG